MIKTEHSYASTYYLSLFSVKISLNYLRNKQDMSVDYYCLLHMYFNNRESRYNPNIDKHIIYMKIF